MEENRSATLTAFEPYLAGPRARAAARESAIGQLRLKKESIVLVVCACRKLQKEMASKRRQLAAQGVLVLDRAALKALYGPSLWGRPQFMLPATED